MSLDAVVWTPPTPPKVAKLGKSTLAHLPTIKHLFPSFRVAISKPRVGLLATSLNDEQDQLLCAPESDSYFGDDMDVDDQEFLGITDSESELRQPLPLDSSETVEVMVTVKASSICVGSTEHALPAPSRSAALVSGEDEDSLILLLVSGMTLLIRMWKDEPNKLGGISETDEHKEFSNYTFTPLVVQWWDCNAADAMQTAGFQILVHPKNHSVAVAAASSVVRVHRVVTTPQGLLLGPHVNIPVDGVVLLATYAYPPENSANDHNMLLVVVFSPLRRLNLCLFSWYGDDDTLAKFDRSILPLTNNFLFPVMVVPLPRSDAFVLVYPDEFVVVSVHNIVLADYGFRKFAYDGAFPTAVSYGGEPVRPRLEASDGFVLAAADGAIWAIDIVNGADLTSSVVARVADPISEFLLVPSGESWVLHYASDTGSAKSVQFELLPENLSASDSGHVTLVANYPNWAPVVDMAVVPARNLRGHVPDELWLLHGAGRRMKLSQMRFGHRILRHTPAHALLRKVNRLFTLSNGLLVCSSPFSTRVLDLRDESSHLVELDAPELDSLVATVHMGEILDFCIQVTASSLVVTDFETRRELKVEGDILLAASGNERLYLYSLEASGSYLLSVLALDLKEQDTLVASSRLLLDDVSALVARDDLVCAGLFSGKVSIFRHQADALALVKAFDLPVALVPHSIVFLNGSLAIGTQTGQYVVILLDDGLILQNLQLGFSPLSVSVSSKNSDHVIARAKLVWFFDYLVDKNPNPLLFDGKYDSGVLSLAQLSLHDDSTIAVAAVRESGLVLGSFQIHREAVPKSITVGGPFKYLAWLDFVGLFALLARSGPTQSRIRFVDRKFLCLLPSVEVDSKTLQDRDAPIFASSELILCSMVWEIKRQDRVSKKLLVGTLKGIRVLDIQKGSAEDGLPLVRVAELFSLLRPEPVTNIAQMDSVVFFSCASTIHAATYSLEGRKFRNLSLSTVVSSDVTCLSVSGNQLLVSTAMDSMLVFEYLQGGAEDELKVVLKDPVPRGLISHVRYHDYLFAGDKLHSSLIVFEPNRSSLQMLADLNLGMIPRLALGNFRYSYSDKKNDQVVAVGVNGEICLLEYSYEDEYAKFEAALSNNGFRSLQQYSEIADRPFTGKVTGKGLYSIYKPFFRLARSEEVLDYDNVDLPRVS